MRLWRLTRTGQTALDGAGTLRHGGRYTPPGAPVVNFASEAGLAVLVALRYLPGDPADAPDDYVLGWTDIDAIPESVGDAHREDAIRDWVTNWLEDRRSLLAAVRSQVLPEADVVLMNPLHPDAARVQPLVTGRSASPSASTRLRCWRATPVRATLRRRSQRMCARLRQRSRVTPDEI
jgi:RES domain-containing protein